MFYLGKHVCRVQSCRGRGCFRRCCAPAAASTGMHVQQRSAGDCRGAKPLPPEPGRTPDLPLYVTAFKDRVSIFRDLSGVSLHRRGYRSAMHRQGSKQ